MTTPHLAPLHRQIVVAATPERTFEVFTGQIGAWWPLARFSVGGAESTVEFRDHRLVETTVEGVVHDWGEMTDWTSPERLAFTWHPVRTDGTSSQVEVTFVEVADVPPWSLSPTPAGSDSPSRRRPVRSITTAGRW